MPKWTSSLTAISGRTVWEQSKLPILVLLYPGLVFVLMDFSEGGQRAPQTLISGLNWALYSLVGLSLLFPLAISMWAWQYRDKPERIASVFRPGLYLAAGLAAVIIPAQGILLGIAMYAADPEEDAWVWCAVPAIGAVTGVFVMLHSGIGKKPELYMSLRGFRISLEKHPRLKATLDSLCQTFSIALPPHVVVGLMPEFFSSTRTVFCLDGELKGGMLYLSLPTSATLSLLEFQALAVGSLLRIHADLTQNLEEFLRSSEGAAELLSNLKDSVQQWRWFPEFGLHPALVAIRFIVVATMRLPLLLGKEWMEFYVKAFWKTRIDVDQIQALQVNYKMAQELGKVQIVSALLKEAALSLAFQFRLAEDGRAIHALGEIALQAVRVHPDLIFEASQPSLWGNPFRAWYSIRNRCAALRVSLEWCHNIALELSPQPPASSLFEDEQTLNTNLVEALKSPFIRPRN